MPSDALSGLNAPIYVRLRERLRDDIVAGVWPLGQHVTIADLSTHYGVSGNPIREALLHLQGDGIVEMRMHRGAVIPRVDRRFVENVYDLSAAIGGMLAREAARRITPAGMEEIEQAAAAFERQAALGNVAATVVTNRRFHSAINAFADNPPAIAVLGGRPRLIDALRVSIGYSDERLAAIRSQHRSIVDALRRRDGKAAAKAVKRHSRSARDDLLSRMDAAARRDGTA